MPGMKNPRGPILSGKRFFVFVSFTFTKEVNPDGNFAGYPAIFSFLYNETKVTFCTILRNLLCYNCFLQFRLKDGATEDEKIGFIGLGNVRVSYGGRPPRRIFSWRMG